MFCETCPKRNTCNTACEPVNNYLRNQGIYSANYIRKHSDTPMGHKEMDRQSAKKAMKLRYGISHLT